VTNTSIIAGGRQPVNRIAGSTYNPKVGGTTAHPAEFPIGTPVTTSPTAGGTVIPGNAAQASTASVPGLAAGSAVVGSSVIVQMSGVLHLTTEQWDAVTGQTGGLTDGATYFLSADAEGMMTTIAPLGDGELVTPLGMALSPEDFLIQIGAATAGLAVSSAAAAMFFGTTAGTGSAGNDYAATVAAGTAVPFPRNGPATGTTVTRASGSTFTVASAGLYEVSWTVAFLEESQLQLAVGGAGVANTATLSGAGTQINSNTVLIALSAGDVVSLINPPGNATALTVQTADGSLTHAQAPNLTFQKIA